MFNCLLIGVIIRPTLLYRHIRQTLCSFENNLVATATKFETKFAITLFLQKISSRSLRSLVVSNSSRRRRRCNV